MYMYRKINRMLRKISWFFSVVLLADQLKHNKFLLLPWLIFWGAFQGYVMGELRMHYLILSPEYLGGNAVSSFFVVGVMMGGFVLAYDITAYILSIQKYPFLGAFPRPFTKFCLNNCIVPVFFLGYYLYAMVQFQLVEQLASTWNIVGKLAGFLGGMTGVLVVSFLYILYTNKDVGKLVSTSRVSRLRNSIVRKLTSRYDDQEYDDSLPSNVRVRSYLDLPFRVEYIRELTDYYDQEEALKVLHRNYLNLIFFEISAISLFFSLSM